MGTDSTTNVSDTYEIECPQCKTTKYRNPQMKLMVNVCGHALCENCVKRHFTKETGQCLECDMVVKRVKFRLQLFQDPLVEKEIDIRRKVMRVYNKLEEDFDSTNEYDDYLEEIETIVCNLVNDIDKVEMEKRIEMYERMHREEIKRNSIRRSAADEELIKIIEEEKLHVLRRQQEQKKEMQEMVDKQNNRNASLLKDLMTSDADAEAIVSSHAEKLRLQAEEAERERLLAKLEEKQNNPLEFSSGVRIGYAARSNDGENAAAMKNILSQIVDYTYTAPPVPSTFRIPEWNELDSLGYLKHVRQVNQAAYAGGYSEHYACLKALTEFFTGQLV